MSPRVQSRPQTRGGVTLIELLTVVGIIGVLVGLLLPAVQSSREAMRRSSCAGNLRQIGLALEGYHMAAGSLPPGRIMSFDPRIPLVPPCGTYYEDKSFLIGILPFLEQTNLYNAVNQSVSIYGRENRTVWRVGVSTYLCPSDPATQQARPIWHPEISSMGFATLDEPLSGWYANYAGMSGSVIVPGHPNKAFNCQVSSRARSQANGCIGDFPPVTHAKITDGLSQTMLVAERALEPMAGFTAYEATMGYYFAGDLGQTIVSAMLPPNHNLKEGAAISPFSASSLHPGGLNVLMADGSVHFVKETISSWPVDADLNVPLGSVIDPADGAWLKLPAAGVWQALGSRNGGETVGGGPW